MLVADVLARYRIARRTFSASDMLPKDAIAFLRDKKIMTKAEFEQLDDQYKTYAFTVARVEQERLIAKVRDELIRAVEEGATLEQFRLAIDNAFDNAGVSRLQKWHTEVIFRNNIQSAYNAGHWQMLQDPDVKDLFPAYRYITMEDERVRPTHAAMHGLVFAADDPIWKRWWPPNGHNCRCTVQPLTAEEAKGTKLDRPPKNTTNAAGELIPVVPDDGWQNNPGMADVFNRVEAAHYPNPFRTAAGEDLLPTLSKKQKRELRGLGITKDFLHTDPADFALWNVALEQMKNEVRVRQVADIVGNYFNRTFLVKLSGDVDDLWVRHAIGYGEMAAAIPEKAKDILKSGYISEIRLQPRVITEEAEGRKLGDYIWKSNTIRLYKQPMNLPSRKVFHHEIGHALAKWAVEKSDDWKEFTKIIKNAGIKTDKAMREEFAKGLETLLSESPEAVKNWRKQSPYHKDILEIIKKIFLGFQAH